MVRMVRPPTTGSFWSDAEPVVVHLAVVRPGGLYGRVTDTDTDTDGCPPARAAAEKKQEGREFPYANTEYFIPFFILPISFTTSQNNQGASCWPR